MAKAKATYHSALLLALLFYGYATGVFSNRKLDQATYDSLACRFITAATHPDHDTIATFRKRFLDETCNSSNPRRAGSAIRKFMEPVSLNKLLNTECSFGYTEFSEAKMAGSKVESAKTNYLLVTGFPR